MTSITFPDAALRRQSQSRAYAAGTATPGYASSAAPSLFDHDAEKAGGPEYLEKANTRSRQASTAQADVYESNWPTDWRAWTTLAACFFLMFNSWGLVNAYGTFASYYKDVLLPNEDALYFNLFGATECFMVLSLSGIVGRLLDAGYYRYLTGAGAFLVTLSFMLLSVVNGGGERHEGSIGLIWLTHGFLAGLGMSCFFVSSSQSTCHLPSQIKSNTRIHGRVPSGWEKLNSRVDELSYG